MKELSTEEKAKRYNKALDEAKAIHKAIRKDLKPVIEQIFPELKETEDERIRKALITFFQRFPYDNPENAGNLENAGTNAKEVLAWLEKQGEQKSADKVEPKFKVGDWVVYNYPDTIYPVCKIIRVDKRVVDLVSENGSLFQNTLECLNVNYHLWTIQDAKDGDVLVSANNQPFIYNGKYTDSTIGAHIGISYDGKEVFIAEGYNWTANKDVKPATKEQRNLLFQRMKEDGYEWNADEMEKGK